MQKGKLLLVHIDPVVEELASRALRHFPVDMDAAQSASDALRRMRLSRYRVIVADRDAIGEMLPAIAALHPRPVVIAVNVEAEELDPELVTLVVPPAYDAHLLVGVMLACLDTARFALGGMEGEAVGDVC